MEKSGFISFYIMNYSKATLNNGIRLLTIPIPSVKSATLAFYVATGSRYESPEISGISHFLEHMLFKGSRVYPTAKDIFSSVERMGGVLNGWTDTEATAYWIKVPSDYVNKALEILTDMVFHSLIDKKELEKERQVILEEVARSNDQPDELAFKNLEGLLWPNQSLGRPILGSLESLNKINQEIIVDYWHGQYTGPNIVFGVSGDFNQEAVTDYLSSKIPDDLNKNPLLSWEKEVVNQNKPNLMSINKNTDQTHLSLGYRSLSIDDPKRFASSVLNAILGGGASSRLFQNIRENLGLAYAIGSEVLFLRDTGETVIQAGLNTGKTERALEETLKEIKQIRNNRVESEELNRAKEMLKGHFLLGLEDSHSVLDFFMRQEISTGKILIPDQVTEKINQVTVEDIEDVARRVFNRNNLNLSLVTPLDKKNSLQSILDSFE